MTQFTPERIALLKSWADKGRYPYGGAWETYRDVASLELPAALTEIERMTAEIAAALKRAEAAEAMANRLMEWIRYARKVIAPGTRKPGRDAELDAEEYEILSGGAE